MSGDDKQAADQLGNRNESGNRLKYDDRQPDSKHRFEDIAQKNEQGV